MFCFFCLGFSTFISAFLLLIMSFLYGMEALGPRGGGANRNASPNRRPKSTSKDDGEEGQELMVRDGSSSEEFTALESPVDTAR